MQRPNFYPEYAIPIFDSGFIQIRWGETLVNVSACKLAQKDPPLSAQENERGR